MRKIAKKITLLTLVLALALVPVALADQDAAVKGICDALLAEGSGYSQIKAIYAEYYPETVYEETLNDQGFTIAISGSEYMDGSWTFERDGDDLTIRLSGDDDAGLSMVREVISAVGSYYGMDTSLISGYVSGLGTLGLESDNFSITTDETDGATDIRINIAGPWEMPELDEMTLDAAAMGFEPLDEDYCGMAGSCGKLMMVANGSANDLTILLGEYGGLDELAYKSLINLVETLQPKGYEAFAADFTELADAEAEGYSVLLNADADAVGEIIGDMNDSYSYAIVRFGGAAGEADYDFEASAFVEEAPEAVFAEWNPDAPALNALIEYVEAVTDPDSPDFIPEMDRIATFDMDGTLMGELYPTYLEYYMLAWRILKDPDCQPDAEMLEVGRLLRDCALDNSFPEDMAMRHALAAAKAYSGMTLNEFSDFVTKILVREVDGFEGMTYGECFYLPMVEVVEYLQDNGFTCYICSGSDRFICRVFIEGMLEIPYNNVIGMDVQLESTQQGDEEGLNHTFSIGEDVVRTDKLLIKNLKTNKVLQIAQEIGQQPVLSFGNSSGDTSMHNYVIGNNAYRSAAFMLVADDDVRDYGNPEKGAALKEKWEAAGYNVISMRDDWKTIYGEDVHKTGEFHWLEELAEDRVPVDAEIEAED